MQQATGPSTTSGAFEPLRPLRPRQTVRPGCLSALAGPALGLGLWLIGIAILVRPQDGSPRSVVIAGGVLAATGLFVLLVRMRRTIHAVVPVPELAIGQGECLTPGALVPLRVRLRGPARLDRLKVTLVCERRYSEQTMTPGTTSLSAVDRVDAGLDAGRPRRGRHHGRSARRHGASADAGRALPREAQRSRAAQWRRRVVPRRSRRARGREAGPRSLRPCRRLQRRPAGRPAASRGTGRPAASGRNRPPPR